RPVVAEHCCGRTELELVGCIETVHNLGDEPCREDVHEDEQSDADRIAHGYRCERVVGGRAETCVLHDGCTEQSIDLTLQICAIDRGEQVVARENAHDQQPNHG